MSRARPRGKIGFFEFKTALEDKLLQEIGGLDIHSGRRELLAFEHFEVDLGFLLVDGLLEIIKPPEIPIKSKRARHALIAERALSAVESIGDRLRIAGHETGTEERHV